MMNMSLALAMLALATAAPEFDQPAGTRGAKPAEASGQRVEPPCAGPACPVPVPFPSTKATDAAPGAPASTDLITIPLCPSPSGGTAQSNGNEAGTSSGNCSKPMGLGPPPDVKH
ncbi:MAG: hypothetical protein KA482_11950 [Sphingobium sp.]|jgi:hypothetical protein|nr:hypothetical protein [Sphingobium sp.]